MFDLFTQADRSLDRSHGGLGVGLTIVRNVVELHGGTVTVDSAGPGTGSEFVVRLPLSARSSVSDSPAPKERAVVSSVHVLVIEDNADNRDMLRTVLEVNGHRVDVAEDGQVGIEMARSVRPEVAFIDIGLPGCDGYEVARQIRSVLGKSIRLVALTGYGQADDRRRTREAGFNLHLVKPVTPETICSALG